ncbi:hypothetical protein PHYPSEUDO_007239 [Phytophthora pseudosyringae]|uniref:Integrator complex subunit 4/Protein SIEL C-terminal Ig-like domain-containing protein n=1 Tax=Phytophthora pseudosyringae TaxID=221518 RepID=A0A8T1VJR2_9STRA|nr:hypothetical protein PHYPSEUDO_007239 [Phytophthora pseudosyringae]
MCPFSSVAHRVAHTNVTCKFKRHSFGMSSASVKRDRAWEASASGGDSAAPATESDSKRPRISSPTYVLSSAGSPVSQLSVLASVQGSEVHPMAVLDAIRARLQSTSDPHLQARLLLKYSSAAASPGAKTAAAIDFLFSFLQQNQTSNDGNQTSKDAGSSGAIVVGAIVRGLRQLLAVKAAVVEPMIQVDAMGEQLMQCMSVGEDFKLRRDMLRIVVDCLMLTKKYKQVEALLHTCVQDHDAGMQAICLRGYLRLHDAGRCFAAEWAWTPETQDAAVDHFDRLAGFVLFALSGEVRVLAAQVLVALADLHPHNKVAGSKYFPSSTATNAALLLPEKAFYVLCMAGNDASEAVRAEVARSLRGFSRVLASEVVEHAVVKTQIDEAVVDVAPEVVEMNTRRMMSSGVLLSLLEDIDTDVAAEASRTIARLSEMAATTPDTSTARWSQRVLERAITAHFAVLPRASISSASQLRHVLVNSLGRLLVCRHTLETRTDFAISSADLGSLLRTVVSDTHNAKPAAVEILRVLHHCDLSSTWAVRRLVDYVLETAASTSFESLSVDDADNSDCWDERFLDAVRDLGKKCSKVLQADIALSDRVRQETSPQRSGQRRLLKSVGQALLGHLDPSTSGNADATNKAPTAGSSLFFLNCSPLKAPRTGAHTSTVSSQATSSMDILRTPPADGNIAVSLKAIHRLRTAFATDDLDISFRVAEVLVRLRQHVHSFPDASTAAAPMAHKYVSMSAMLSTSPSVSSGHTNSSNQGSQSQKEADAFASLHLPNDLRKGCQEMVDLASGVYVKAFALSSSPRTDLLQLIMLGRVGLVLALLQSSADSLLIIEKLRWVAKEAARLRFLVNDGERKSDLWLPAQLLADVRSLNDLKCAFVAIIRKAWPTALIEAAIARCTAATGGAGVLYRRLAIAQALILEPTTRTKSEPREITANWPFEQRVRFLVADVRDGTQVYVKSVLPNGNMAYHHVPANCIRNESPRKQSVDHTITLTVSPFSDPTAFMVAVCLGHPTLPGSITPSTPGSGETSPRMFTEISGSVRVPIFHRTSSTLKHAAARSSTA